MFHYLWIHQLCHVEIINRFYWLVQSKTVESVILPLSKQVTNLRIGHTVSHRSHLGSNPGDGKVFFTQKRDQRKQKIKARKDETHKQHLKRGQWLWLS